MRTSGGGNCSREAWSQCSRDGERCRVGNPAIAARLGLVGALLLYPYCGVSARAATERWQRGLPVAVILVADDGATDERACLRLAARMAEAGRVVETTVLDGPTHAFDQREREPFSLLRHDPMATARALRIGLDALARFRAEAAPAICDPA